MARAVKAFLVLLSLKPQATGMDVEDALASDDQCRGGSSDCAVNALQIQQRRVSEDMFQDLEVESWLEDLWHSDTTPHAMAGADVSYATAKSILVNASSLQKEVMTLWHTATNLSKQVEETVKKVDEKSGLQVKNFIASSLLEDEESELKSVQQSGLPPREAKVRKSLTYLEKEMSVVFRKLNSVDKMNAAIGNLITKNPVPLALQKKSLLQIDESTIPDHLGKADELEAYLVNVVNMVHRAQTSQANLENHMAKIDTMIEHWLAGELIPVDYYKDSK